MARSQGGAPFITAVLSLATLAVWLIPGANALLQWDRFALTHGEWWRVVTGHFTHWSTGHLAWDVAAFALLGSLVERQSRALLAVTLAVSALAISAGVVLLEPGLATYRGLSGIDSALFAAAVVPVVFRACVTKVWVQTVLPLAATIGFAAKVAIETTSASTLFVAPDAAFVPVPSAHLVGALAGAAGAFLLIGLRTRYSSIANAAQVAAA